MQKKVEKNHFAQRKFCRPHQTIVSTMIAMGHGAIRLVSLQSVRPARKHLRQFASWPFLLLTYSVGRRRANLSEAFFFNVSKETPMKAHLHLIKMITEDSCICVQRTGKRLQLQVWHLPFLLRVAKFPKIFLRKCFNWWKWIPFTSAILLLWSFPRINQM